MINKWRTFFAVLLRVTVMLLRDQYQGTSLVVFEYLFHNSSFVLLRSSAFTDYFCFFFSFFLYCLLNLLKKG